MSEILLQNIVEKLEGFEIAFLRKSSDEDPALQSLLQEIKLLRSETGKLPLQFNVSSEKMGELLKGIRELNFNLNRPIREQIKHSHHLHKGIWIAILLFVICCVLSYGWINCYNAKKSFEANDIKYRYLKGTSNVSLLKILYQTDSLYNLHADSFEKLVEEKKQNIARKDKQIKLDGEKKKGAERLRN